MADHPTDIGNAPPHIAGLHAVDMAHGIAQRHGIAAVFPDDALGFAGGAGGVHDVQRVGGGQLHRRHRAGRGHGFEPVQVAAFDQRRPGLRTLQHQHLARLVLGQLQGTIHQRFVLDDPVELQPARGGQQQRGPGIVDAQGQFVGGKATKHHRMHRANAGTGEHGHGRLRHHGHVDDHPVALLDPKLAQQAGQARHLVAQLVVAELLLAAGHRRVVDQRSLLATALLDLMIKGQVAAVEPAVGKPLVGAVGVFSKGLQGLAVPGQVVSLFGPEGGRIGDGAGVAVLVCHRM
ncbi:hypothetical protein D3C76_882170 [compost metagenome]